MTTWAILSCEKCQKDMKESPTIEAVIYSCPKCGIKVKLRLIEDYDQH